ncbi:talin-1-like isoform X3 [Ptychodera flava]|uniref:talin-1-like isoform X3 n=1 Tax=Ptychodera flava TaxID=63121 RepID=UPI00396A5683
MAALSLKISVVGSDITKTMQFDPSTIVYDACRIIRERVKEANSGEPNEYGLFLADEDPKKGVWLEAGRSMEYYLLRSGDLLEYKKKMRPLRAKMLDGAIKTVMIDDSHIVSQIVITICARLGVTNHEEYSLCKELEMSRDGTINRATLKKEKAGLLTLQKDEKKMEELRKKLHTDDELNWLDHTRTLREQGVEEGETLIFRRKYFYSDQNVDSRDPVQLNLLYIQCRDNILNGTHPCSLDEACQLAGTQCQIQYGEHIESKHKPGFLDLKLILPKEYVKTKGVEKRIFAEHKKLRGVNELDAKVRYTQLCRSLKTYGITFFLVKEKMKGKNKLVPRLLGINKESIVRVDEKTKEILKTWPLTCVRRWAASPKSFTLDFGDYSESYYSVQTTEGEQISALIAGYIDIILKKKKGSDRYGLEGDDDAMLLEDNVSPARATIMQHQTNKIGHASTGSVALPAIMRAGGSAASYSTGTMQAPQYGSMKGQAHSAHTAPMASTPKQPGLSTAQQGLMGNITVAITEVERTKSDLEKPAELPPLGTDPASLKWKQDTLDVSRQNIQSQLGAMSAATAGIVTLTSGDPDDTNYTAVGSAVTTISSNLPELVKSVRLLSALLEDDKDGHGEKLLDATRKLAGAFSDLLKAAQPGSKEGSLRRRSGPRQSLLTAANNIGTYSADVQNTIGDFEVDPRFQDTLMALAKAVANATAALVLKAKNVASKTEDPQAQNRVIQTATSCALNTSQLVACTKVVAPTISSPACQEQLVEAAKLVAKSVEGVVDSSQNACDDEDLLKGVGEAATAVTKALNDLLQHVRRGTAQATPSVVDKYDAACDTILTATDKLFSSMGDAAEMVKQAKILAQATSQLVNGIKGEAESAEDSELQKKLLGAAKMVADATARMVEAAKACARDPNDPAQQQKLREAAEDLRAATDAAASNALQKKLIVRLENAAKQAAAIATQTIAAAQGAGQSNRNEASQQQLIIECKNVADHIPKLIHGVRDCNANPDSPTAQLNLINASKSFIQPGTKMIIATKAAVPTIGDQASALQLGNNAKQLATILSELRTAANKAQEACGSLELDSALDTIRALDNELGEIKKSSQEGKLLPLPGETLDGSALELGATSKTVGSSMAQLLTAAAQGNENYTGIAARDTAQALTSLTKAVRGVAATSQDAKVSQALIDSARGVMDKSELLMEEVKRALNNPNDPDNQQRLAQVAKAVSNALNNTVNCLPGQRDVDNALKTVSEASKVLLTGKTVNEVLHKSEYSHTLPSKPRDRPDGQMHGSYPHYNTFQPHFPDTKHSYQEVQGQLNTAAAGLNVSASELIAASRGTHEHLAHTAGQFTSNFTHLLDAGIQMAGATQSTEGQTQMVGSLKTISMSSSKLLLAVKSLSADPNAPNVKNNLAAAARAVTESINQLINTCTKSAPGQKEIDNALRNIQTVKPMLDNTTEPVNDWSYFDCLDNVMDKSKVLGESMAGMTEHAKNGEVDKFGASVDSAGDAVCGLTEAAAQSAYLVGISDPSSVAGKPGLVDQSQFARANQAIQLACQNLLNPNSNQQQVLSAATVVAKHTSALCNACRIASSKTSNPVAKKHFVQSAKDVANSTANLVKSIKALDGNFSDENRQKCAAATRPLLEAVDNLCTFASSPEFASIPAKISVQAKKAQEPIIVAGKAVIESSSALLQTAKPLISNPKEPSTWQLLASHSKNVSDSIKRLVSAIRDKAPGQKECDDAIDTINSVIKDLDQASLAAVSQHLVPRQESNVQGFQEQMANSAGMIGETVDKVAQAAKGHPEQLGHQVASMANYFLPLANAAIGVASKTMNSQQQSNILDLTKTVAESALQLMYAAKEGGGNPKNTHTHSAIDEAADGMKEAVDDLNKTLEECASEFGIVTGMVDSISRALSRTDDPAEDELDGFVDYQTKMVKSSRAIVVTTQDYVTKANTNVGELGTLGNTIAHDYNELAGNARGAMATSNSDEVSDRIKVSVQDLGKSCIDLVRLGGVVQGNPTDSMAKKELVDNARVVSEKASYVLAALQSGSRGTQACINAASTVSGIIGDLDTTIMFATAGTLHSETDGETFADHREHILKTAKALVEDTKTLVSGAASSQEQLAAAAQSAVCTITRLADVVKLGAASLGGEGPEAQVLLINAVKDVASALGELITTTKMAAGKAVNDPAMIRLKNSAKVMVTNVTSLLKTVKTVEDEAARGTRALESTIEVIGQDARAFDSPEVPGRTATAEELIRATKPVTLATAKAVAAGNSGRQDDVIATANMGRKAIAELIIVVKSAAAGAEHPEVHDRTLLVGKECAYAYKDLLEHVQATVQKPTLESKQNLVVYSKRVATAVGELVQCAEALKGSDWVDPEDPNVIAENELLSAASSIEAAARKLQQLRPREQTKFREADENLNFAEQILEAAKAIASATSVLVKAASAAQRELVAQGKIGAIPANAYDDGQWSLGLISAARKVAVATNNLCEAANSAVQGHASEERLISSAKAVASSTAQLLVACKVKADTFSEPMRRLQAAGNAVKRASDNLVRAAQQASEWEEERLGVELSKRMVGSIAQEIQAQEIILMKEKELEVARKQLAAIRQAKYKNRPPEEQDSD